VADDAEARDAVMQPIERRLLELTQARRYDAAPRSEAALEAAATSRTLARATKLVRMVAA